MAYAGSNDDVIDDVTLPLKAKIVIPISLRPVISKTVRDRDSVTESLGGLVPVLSLVGNDEAGIMFIVVLYSTVNEPINAIATCCPSLLCRWRLDNN